LAVNWAEFEGAAPQLATLGRERFERDQLALVGTLRVDGSPRISPVAPYLALGHLLLGMEWPTSKARDLLRDDRCVVHSVVSDPDGADGEFKLYGRALLVEDEAIVREPTGAWWRDRRPGSYRVFTIDIDSAAFIGWDIEADQMHMMRWSPADGLSDVTHDRLS
jgi:hypothetical protein